MTNLIVGRVIVEDDRCVLEHRSTSNHVLRNTVLRFEAGQVATPAQTLAYLTEAVGARSGSWLLLEGEWAGEGDSLHYLLSNATRAPLHRGVVQHGAGKVYLIKANGTRLLRRFGSDTTAAQMVKNEGYQDYDPITVRGIESVSSTNMVVIEIEALDEDA